MKKISLILMAMLISCAFLTAQNTGIVSVMSDSSSGLFENALDDAANVGEGFSMLENSYLFAGVSNIELTEADQFITFDDTGNGPLWTGFFVNGAMPWSLFLGFDADNLGTANGIDDTVNTIGGTETVVSGTTSTDYQWNSQVVDTEFTANRLLDNFEAQAQFLTILGPLNTGLYFSMDLTDTSVQANNSVETDTRYTNTGGAGAIPVETFDYSITTTDTDLNTQNVFQLGVPLFLATGDMQHEANILLGLDLTHVEIDNAPSIVYSNTSVTNLGVITNNEVDKDTTDTTVIDVDLDYNLILPGLTNSHRDNEFSVGVEAGIGIQNVVFNTTTIDQDVNFAGAGAAGVDQARAENTTDVTIDPVADFNFGVNVSHSFYFDLGPAMFAFEPTLNFDMNIDNSGSGYELVTVAKVDGDADGAFTSALDTITTSTTTFVDDDGTGTSTKINTFTTVLSLPVALRVSPEKWPFSLTLGSTPRLRMLNTLTEVKDRTSSTNQTVVNQGDGTNVSDTTTVQNLSSDTSMDIDHDLSITADHNIGLHVPVGEFVELDVNLGLSSGASILEFRDFVLQAIVALP